MKKFLRFLLFAALMVPLGARAQQTLTVADGTTTNGYIPVYGFYTDAAQHNQIIYPSSMLNPLIGDSIKSIEFYMASTASSSWGTTVTISLAEVSESTLSSTISAPVTQVWTGVWTGMTDTLHVNFTQGFAYHGGNLLVDITTTAASYSSASFYGISSSGSSNCNYYSSNYPQDFLPKTTFTTVPGAFPFCPPAAGFSVQANSYDATFTWTAGSAASYVLYLGDSLIGEVTSPLTVTDLTPGTDYTASLVAVCASGDSSIASQISFFTPCVAFSAPYTEGFESNNTTGCFNVLQSYNSYGTIYPQMSSSYKHSGSSSYQFYYGNLVVLPDVDLAANEMHVSFWAYNTSGMMEAGYMTDPNVDTTFVPMVTVPDTENEWLEYEFYLDGLPAGDTVHIAFRHSTYYYSYIDDITIEHSSDCRRPAVSSIDSMTATTALISWSSSGDGAEYEVGYSTDNNAENAVILSGNSDTVYTITGLNPNVMYWLWVRTVCGDSTTAWHYIGHARTDCGSMVAPVIEDFTYQNYGEAPSCWTILASTDSYGTIYPMASSSQYLYFYPRYQEPNAIAMPHVNLQPNEMSIIVYAHKYSYGASYEATMEIGYVTSLDSNAVFNVIDTMNITSSSQATPDELEFNTSMLPSTLDTIYLAFRASTGGSYGYGYIDAVEVRHLSNCNRPAAVALDEVTYNSATLSWNEVQDVNGYVVRYATNNNVNAISAVDIEVVDGDTSIVITGLSRSTHYYTWVRSACADDSSDWRQGPDFVTPCGENPCYFVVDMEDGFGDGWNGNAINFIINGNLVSSATLESGSIGTFSQAVCDGDTVELRWVSGSYPDEVSFSMSFAGAQVIANGSGEDYSNGDLLFSTVGCPTCAAPTSIVVDNYDVNSITISWTPANETDAAWKVYLDTTFVADVTTNTYTFTGLTANTDYVVGVATICGDEITNPGTINAYTDCLNGSCALTIDMVDSYGDGWNGNALVVSVDGVPSSYTLEEGSHDVQTVRLCTGQNVLVTLVSGSYPGEVSFSMTFADGHAIVTDASATDYSNGDTIFAGVAVCRTCPTPTALHMTASNGTNATVVWNGGDATSWQVSIVDTTGTTLSTISVNTPTHTFTGLTASSPYMVYVTAICGSADSSWTSSLAINTPCPAEALPWHDDFMAYSALEATPGCWSTPARTTLQGYSYPLMLGSGRYSVIAASMEGDTVATAIAATPQLLGPANNLYVRYKLMSATEGDIDSYSLEAGIMTDVYDPATFVPVATIPNTDGEVEEFEMLTSTLSVTGNAWVAFRAVTHNGAADEGYAAFVLNDVYVQTIPACQRPDSVTVVTAVSSTAVSATLGWPAVSGSTGYTVEVVGDTTFNVTTNSYTFVGLDGNTTYTVRVYNNCSATDRSLPRSVTFTTPCAGFALPYTEGFESYATITPDCWTTPVQYPDYNGNMTPYIYSSSYSSHSGNYSLYFLATNNFHTMAISPALYGQANNVHVSFWVYGSSSMGFEAGIMTDPDVDSTFIPLLNVPSTTYDYVQYEFDTDTLPLTDTVFHFAVRAVTSQTSYYSMYIDDIFIATIPDCSDEFASVKVDRIGGDSAVVNFEPSLGRNENVSYTLQVTNASGQVVDNITANGSPVTIPNLMASTDYQVVVSLICGGTVTAVSDPVSFTTRCAGSSTIEISDTNSTAGIFYPVYPYYNHSVSQAVYPGTLLGAATTFQSLSVNCSTTNATLTGFRGRIWMKEVSDTIESVDSWYSLDSMTLVYDGDLPLENGWNEFLFSTPFEYSGQGNVVVCMMADTTFGTYKSGYNFYRHPAPEGTTRYKYNDNTDWAAWMASGETGTDAPYRADMRFSSCGNAVCIAPSIDSVMAAEDNIYVHFSDVADMYDVAIVEGSSWTEPSTYTEIDSNSFNFVGRTPSTTYTIGVRSVCEAGSYSDWITRTVTTAEHPCYAPTGVTASNPTLDGATITWTPAEANQDEFELYFATAGDTIFVISTTTNYTATGLLNNTTYSVAVRAICGENNYSDWSNAATFTTVGCQAVSGVTVSAVTTTGATVTWTSNGSSSYEVGYGPIGTTTDNCTRRTTTTASYTITGLEEGLTYVVYVRAICAEGVYSDWTSGTNFTTETQGIDDVDNANISLYPNPASSTVTLAGIEGQATVTVVDMNGRQVYTGNTANGSLTIDVNGMAQGAYFVRITGERVNAIRKLIVR